MNLSKIKKTNGGFTLVESLVAVGILSISILATFTAVSNGLRSSGISKDQITAFYLIQEGMEFIKNTREENAIKNISGTPTDWLAGISEVGGTAPAGDPCYSGRTCRIDSANKTITYCGVSFGSCPVLQQSPSTSVFGYGTGWVDTIFKREIQIESINADEIRVTIQVSWTGRGVVKSVKVSQSLFKR